MTDINEIINQLEERRISLENSPEFNVACPVLEVKTKRMEIKPNELSIFCDDCSYSESCWGLYL